MDARDAMGEPVVTVSRSALIHNAAVVRRAVGRRVKICATVKANAYGHGAATVVDALANFSTNDFGTTSVGRRLRRGRPGRRRRALPETVLPVLVLRPVENCFVGRQRARVELAVRSGWWLTGGHAHGCRRRRPHRRRGRQAGPRPRDGRHRHGPRRRVGPDELPALLDRIDRRAATLRLAGLYTHFANGEGPRPPADDRAAGDVPRQDRRDRRRRRRPADPPRRRQRGDVLHPPGPTSTWSARAWRCTASTPRASRAWTDPLRPALRWTAPLVGLRDVPAGGSVGYGQTWRAERPTRVGLVPVGYADGYARAYGNRAVTLVHGSVAPVVGRVSMDLMTIDLSQVPSAAVGDEVTLLDDDPLSVCSVYRLAEWAETIPYEVLSRIGPPRPAGRRRPRRRARGAWPRRTSWSGTKHWSERAGNASSEPARLPTSPVADVQHEDCLNRVVHAVVDDVRRHRHRVDLIAMSRTSVPTKASGERVQGCDLVQQVVPHGIRILRGLDADVVMDLAKIN